VGNRYSSSFRLTFQLAALFLLVAGPASAQVSTQDRKCIEAVNSGAGKVSQTQQKTVATCARLLGKGLITLSGFDDCISPSSFKLSAAISKGLIKAANSCRGELPAFGPPSITGHLDVAIAEGEELLEDIFGPSLGTALSTTGDTASCQGQVLKAITQCQDTRYKTFLSCKSNGLKGGAINNTTQLRNLCFGTGATQPDPTGKIAKLCVTLPGAKIEDKCVAEGVDLAAAFPGCNVSTGPDLLNCVNARIRCHVCQTLDQIDAMSRNCDIFDDGNASNDSCDTPPLCGDGVIHATEVCDDGDASGGDGCSATCEIETGYQCSGEPSACQEICGDGMIVGDETCDDSDATGGDGCSATCAQEPGYSCTGEPSTCVTVCGDGLVRGAEICDDGDTSSGDGCSSSCTLESGYSCAGQPSLCAPVCGDSQIAGSETCDDGGTTGGDGCSSACQIESGYSCTGLPSVCNTICGDGLIRGSETCDDSGTTSGNGCSSTCQIETGFSCTGQPSNCTAICGDGLIRGTETCDDDGNTSGDGCSATCQLENGWSCSGQPTACSPICGDGLIRGSEACDDGGTSNGNGCSSTCTIESGFSCTGQPSNCTAICGDGLIRGSETCDDGNTTSGDGCRNTCQVQPGYVCTGAPSTCNQYDVVITSPAHGSFTTSSTQTVTGFITHLAPANAVLTLNDAPVTVNPDRTFSVSGLALSSSAIFNPFDAQLVDSQFGGVAHDRVVRIRGASVADGAHSPQGVALRLTDPGLDQIEPLVADLVDLDLATLLPVNTVLINNACFIDSVFGCLGRATVTVANPPPSISGFSLAMNSMTNFVDGIITVTNIRVQVFINGTGLVPDCGLRLTASSATFNGDYELRPDPVDPHNLDVNQVGTLGVSFSNFQDTFTSGACNDPIIGDIIQAFLPDIEALTRDAMVDFLSDPDGAGPLDSPIADAIEEALAGIQISGPIGEGLGVQLDTPMFAALEDVNGITLGTDIKVTTSVGTGPGQCLPPPQAPNLTASLAVPETFPTYGASTPVGRLPYHMALGISSSGFNQLLKAQVECGLLVSSITQLDFDGPGGNPPVNLNSTILSLIIPQFGAANFPPGTPFRIDLRPTIAPVVTGATGPGGSFAELKVAHVVADIVRNDGSEQIALGGAFDVRMGMNMVFTPTGLGVTLNEPLPEDISIAIIHNPINAAEAPLEEEILPPLVALLIPDLASSLSSFPLPEFFGLEIAGVEVSRQGNFMSMFGNFTPAP